MKKNNRGRKALTIEDWKKRALEAEADADFNKTLITANRAKLNDLENRVKSLYEDLDYKGITIHELEFEAQTAYKQVRNLQRLLEFVAEKIPQEYYHNCFENVKYSSQTMEAVPKNTINYDKNEAKIESSSNE